jgi:hypothetical protein
MLLICCLYFRQLPAPVCNLVVETHLFSKSLVDITMNHLKTSRFIAAEMGHGTKYVSTVGLPISPEYVN